ncbi:MAG: glutathione S-transferase [Rhodocyclaceae bacterium]|nr:glutathione S-transferase [Rhodocyclaceae bacterium]
MRLICSLTSPYARKIRVVLAEKALPFELVEDIPWNEATRVPEFNPLGKVPALVADDDSVWFDSPVIAEYLDVMHPEPPLLPADRRAALPVHQSEALADGIIDASVLAFLERSRPQETRSQAQIDRQYGKIGRGLDALARRLASKAGLDCGQLSIADIAAGCAVGYLDLRFPDFGWRDGRPALTAYGEALLARPSFRDSNPPG